METLYARSVFFVVDTPRAVAFYLDTLGFSLDWTHEEHGRPFVVQVSLFGLQVILNQAESPTASRPGHGRLFVGLDEAQTAALLQHLQDRGIAPTYTQWGAPTLALADLDGNEFFFWLTQSERAKREAPQSVAGSPVSGVLPP